MSTTTLGNTNLTVSRIGLGTVEIGLPYGIGVKELPTDREAERILRAAVELGITYIDTARGYGVAEERIGKFGISQMEGIVIGTKCGQFLKMEPDLRGAALEARIREDIDMSRKYLKQEQLHLVQLHIELADYTDFGELIEIMQKLQHEGKVQHVGVSTRGEETPLAAFAHDFFETCQVAYSILDQRMDSKVLPMAHSNSIGIINRSVLLKGVLTPAMTKLPNQLDHLKKNAQKAADIANRLNVPLPFLAIQFAMSNPAIATTLIGTIEPKHLEVAMQAANSGPLPQPILEELYALAIDDPTQVDPAQWPPIS